jgi:hypothetical protein
MASGQNFSSRTTPDGIKFVLQAGDPLWLNGENTNDVSKVCVLMTKVV